ncbi:hypothetical protein QTP70_019814 [Hemibagrus guttatus]|uniref:EF-hand domain-containing protein n=1 Tax=Hemibagrus guttatus TaxID=175788 RepID=A0AAE0V9Y9_9TELE|nr:hypothetical protein QTP70_019814 [Hemibagrus guttatus]KAK3572219.1 hypothetical protein QTP86_027125 [Hemibagrus guttatus]
MSKLEKAIVAIVEVFEEYAGTDEDKRKLNNAELGALIKAQLSCPEFKDKVDEGDAKEALEGIDKNHDGQVSFKEFSKCVANLSEGYFKKKYGKEKGGKCKHHK